MIHAQFTRAWPVGGRINGIPLYILKQCYFIANNQLIIYLKQYGLKISGGKADLLNEFSATHVEMLPEMLWIMKNFQITRLKMT